MKYSIRKIEKVTSLHTSRVIDLDPKKFKKVKDNPYKGSTEKEFITYIAAMLRYSNIPEDLDEDTKELLMKLEESKMEAYYHSSEDREEVVYQIGKVNPEYRKSGGFEVIEEES
jgi:hypothetical protein